MQHRVLGFAKAAASRGLVKTKATSVKVVHTNAKWQLTMVLSVGAEKQWSNWLEASLVLVRVL
jgi:hypothetical protein